MRKTILSFLLLIASVSVFAQKSYINVFCDSGDADYGEFNVYLSGDIPNGMTAKNRKVSIGKILTQLSSYGYTVEFMCGTASNNNIIYLLSKNSSSSHTRLETKTYDDEETREVARYNLQGMPIGKHEKGIQIIVYSNYTTKTIIVE